MKMKKLVLIIPFVLLGTVINAQTKTIAHRGFWDTEGSAQNSLKSLRLANDIHCFGSEFDVWITKDGEVIVNHAFFTGSATGRNDIFGIFERFFNTGCRCNLRTGESTMPKFFCNTFGREDIV